MRRAARDVDWSEEMRAEERYSRSVAMFDRAVAYADLAEAEEGKRERRAAAMAFHMYWREHFRR